MASFPCYNVVQIITLATTLLLRSSSFASSSHSTNFYHTTYSECSLSYDFYNTTCSNLLPTVQQLVANAIKTETRMGASLLRLHFHDCFVNGCDGSILLDDTVSSQGEKTAAPNLNSVRGFDVIDTIKIAVEKICPETVSCADILTIAARDSVVILGGPYWKVELGRRDSKTASLAAANINIPSPLSNLSILLSNFKGKGLSARDLVALSGGHTIGQAKCSTFKQRLYSETNIDWKFAQRLKWKCSNTWTTDDDNYAPLDTLTPTIFDNKYYTNLVAEEGLLNSDQQLFSVEGTIAKKVRKYNAHQQGFFHDFAKGMTNMGRISPLTGKTNGEIRTDCRKINADNY